MSISGLIKSKLGYYGNFGLGIALILISLSYTIFFLKVSWTLYLNTIFIYFLQDSPRHAAQKETEINTKEVLTKKGRHVHKTYSKIYFLVGLLKSLFDVENVKSAFKTTFKKRDNNMRAYISIIGIYFL